MPKSNLRSLISSQKLVIRCFNLGTCQTFKSRDQFQNQSLVPSCSFLSRELCSTDASNVIGTGMAAMMTPPRVLSMSGYQISGPWLLQFQNYP
jgi:hypothetical protein